MKLVASQASVPTKAEVMRKVFAAWANETAAQDAGRQCIDLLSIIRQRDALSAGDWSQIQKLAEHLVRARRSQARG